VPVLAVDGAQSLLNLGDAERAERRANSRVAAHRARQRRHMLQRHKPAELAKLLADFAATLCDASAP